jgi:hypothetical protein
MSDYDDNFDELYANTGKVDPYEGLNVWWRIDEWLHIHAWRFSWAWGWYCQNLERRWIKKEEAL